MYREEKRSWMKHLDFTLLDLLCQELALLGAYGWRFGGAWLGRDEPYRRLAVIVILIDLVAVFFMENYKGILRRTKYQELRATLAHCIVIFGGVLVYMYATKQSVIYSRQMLFVYLLLAFIFEYIARVLNKRRVRALKLKDVNKSQMTVVCERSNVERCLSEISHNKYTNFKVTGVVVVDDDLRGQKIQGIPVVACADTFLEYVRTNVVDEVFIDGNTRTSTEALAAELVELGVTVHVCLIHTDGLVPNRILENYANYVVLTTSMKIATARQMFAKRLIDLIGSIIGLILTGIAFLIFAPIIYYQSPGPIFYKSVRIGRNGRRFNFYKFRTMVIGADQMKADLMEQNEMQGNMFKMQDDPRIIPIGHFMRKYSIDELPQFLNVLKGDMSLVGTRPPTEDEFEAYQYHHKARLGIKPGLTGMWQVSGRSNIRDFEEIVRYDTYYIANWSLGLDMKILFKTIAVVLSGKGSE